MRKIKLSLGVQAVLTLALPLTVLGWFTYDSVGEANAHLVAAERQILFMDIAGLAGDVVHETQKERGLSTAAVGAGGEAFMAQLPAQRATRNERLQTMKAEVARIDTGLLGPKVSEVLELALSYTAAIEAMRGQVDNRAVPPQGVLEFYQAVVETYLALASNMSRLSEDRVVSDLGIAYTALLRAKEAAGLERALLSNVFAADAFTPETRDLHRSLVAVQETYRRDLLASVTDDQRAAVENALGGDVAQRAGRLRSIAIERADDGRFGVDPVEWFALQSEKIETMKALEDQFIEALQARSELLRAEARGNRITALLIGLLALVTIVFSLFWMILKFRGLQRDLGGPAVFLNEALLRLGKGDFSVDLATTKPATGVMAGLQTMKTLLQAQVEKDARIVAESNRIRQSLDNVESPAIITDTAHRIVFVNRAGKRLIGEVTRDPGYAGTSVDTGHLAGEAYASLPGQHAISREQLAALTATKVVDTELGNRSIRMTANPVFGDDGERLGAIVVWLDRTNEVRVENEVQSVVQAAQAGDLSRRIQHQGQRGFIASLSQSVNDLLSVAEQVVGDTVRVFGAVARGDLRETVSSDYEGSFQTLKNDANATIAKLTEVISAIQNAAASVKGGAQEISQGNNHLRERTEEQASGLEVTRQNMKKLTEMVRQNAESASEANDLAQAAQRKASEGGTVVNGTVAAMQEINAASKRIEDITSVIDEIAFQTNLLALNAAVEAARAGEQGRGFAVVANEVRNLAGRSASAAKEIKSLIQDSSTKVEEGARLADASGRTLEEIVDEVQRLSQTVGAIATSSQQQYRGIDEVNATIIRIDDFTQQNAGMVEQASAASELLGDQAFQLDELATFFELSAEQKGMPMRALPAAASGDPISQQATG